MTTATRHAVARSSAEPAADPREPIARLLRDLGTAPEGLASREALRRRQVYGPNELPRRTGHHWPGALARQLAHPLALLLWGAAILAWVSGTRELAVAIVCVIGLNALLAFFQEERAERAVAALAGYLPATAEVRRDGVVVTAPACELVPGDIVLLTEGKRVPADVRLVSGAVDIDASALTGESSPVERDAHAPDTAARPQDSPVLAFNGTVCVAGEAEAVVHATGRHTELGRIAALSVRVHNPDSPLERQVRRTAWLIAAVSVGVALAFLPLGVFAGLPLLAAATFAIGLLVANVPEGLLPTITLALAVGVRAMARRGALVKRLSAVEALGSATVICTDKTGTLTRNQMHVVAARSGTGSDATGDRALAEAMARCNTAQRDNRSGDPTELALLDFAAETGVVIPEAIRDAQRRKVFRFEPRLKRMTTIDEVDGHLRAHTKGAPEVVLPRCVTALDPTSGAQVSLEGALAAQLSELENSLTGQGLRVLAIARRDLDTGARPDRESAESGLCLLGMVGMLDPPRLEVPAAVRACHTAGIRVHVVTGDNGRTAAQIARRTGIGATHIVDGETLDAMPEPELDAMLAGEEEIVFSRAAPEAKLRVSDALRHGGEVVAMTGDGVNDAPALRRADIGVAMGVGGTDVAKEAADVVLTDDNFATIVAGVEEGRRVYDNVRKFIVYIFTHAVPEVVPFLVFALSGGLVPPPLTVLQILAIDLGTDTLPALALGRQGAEPGLMDRPPRVRGEHVVTRRMLLRAWGVMGPVSAVLVLGGFFAVLVVAGWAPGAVTGAGSALHRAYLQASTMSFLGVVCCQLGTAVAARTDRAPAFAVSLAANRLLLLGCAVALAFVALVVYTPALQPLFGTAAPPLWALAMLPGYPVVVWGADEVFRVVSRHRARYWRRVTTAAGPAAGAG